MISSTLFDLIDIVLCEISSLDCSNWISDLAAWASKPLSFEQVCMIDAMFGSSSESNIPKSHAPPTPADSLTLLLLSWGKLSSLTLSVLDKGLQAHRWAILFQILDVAECLGIRNELHHVSTQIRRRCSDKF